MSVQLCVVLAFNKFFSRWTRKIANMEIYWFIRIEAISSSRSHEPFTAPCELPQKEFTICGVPSLESHRQLL